MKVIGTLGINELISMKVVGTLGMKGLISMRDARDKWVNIYKSYMSRVGRDKCVNMYENYWKPASNMAAMTILGSLKKNSTRRCTCFFFCTRTRIP